MAELGNPENGAFARLLAARRAELGLTFKQLQVMSGLKSDTIYKWEHGVYPGPLTRDALEKLSDALGWPAGTLERVRFFEARGWTARLESVGAKERLPARRCEEFIGRKTFVDGILDRLESRSFRGMVLLSAFGGYGKSEVAREIAAKLLDKGTFRDLVWVRLRPEEFDFGLGRPIDNVAEPSPSPNGVVLAVLRQLACSTVADVKARLLASPTLIVIDNLESMTDEERVQTVNRIQALIGDGPSRALLASRRSISAPVIYQPTFEGLGYRESRDLLQGGDRSVRELTPLREADSALIQEIHTLTKGMPLALHLIRAQSRNYELDRVLQNLRDARAAGPDEPFYSFLYRSSWQELSREAQTLLVFMGVATRSPQSRIQLLNTNPGADITYDDLTLDNALAELSRWYLVERMESATPNEPMLYDLHPLTRAFVLSKDIRQDWQSYVDEGSLMEALFRKHEEIFLRGLGVHDSSS